MEYTEHEKIESVKKESEVIGEFLDWLRQSEEIHFVKRITGKHFPEDHRFERFSVEQILAEYFDIDLNKIESEKRQMLGALG